VQQAKQSVTSGTDGPHKSVVGDPDHWLSQLKVSTNLTLVLELHKGEREPDRIIVAQGC
jgi:hypothetical protein